MQTAKKNVSIAIVDDHNLFRKGLIKLIGMCDKDNKYNVIFEAENGNDLKEKLDRRSLPDIILMDIDMPDMDGYETVDWLRRSHPDVHILVISMLATKEAILRMLKLGVKGYLSKDIEVEDIHMALEAIANKGSYYSDFVTDMMAATIRSDNLQKALDTDADEEVWSSLPENELEFVKFACTELTYQQIAEKMSLSPKTIDGYRESVFHKFNVKTRVSLAMYAVRHGIVKLF